MSGTYFFTVVTERRAPLFEDPQARRLLGGVRRACLARYPVAAIAIVLREFTRAWLAEGGAEQPRNRSRRREGRRGVWQRRYWELTIPDPDDLEAHFDYTHYNPTKHGYVGGKPPPIVPSENLTRPTVRQRAV